MVVLTRDLINLDKILTISTETFDLFYHMEPIRMQENQHYGFYNILNYK